MTSSLSSYSLRKTAETMHRRAAARSCSAIRRSPKTRSMTVHDAWSGRCRHIFHVARAEDRTGDDHDAIGMVSAACRGWARHQTVFTRRRWRPCGDRVHTGSSSSSPSPRRRDMARRESGTLCGEASTSRCVRGATLRANAAIMHLRHRCEQRPTWLRPLSQGTRPARIKRPNTETAFCAQRVV